MGVKLAFLTPPEDGEYAFWLMSDDSSILQIAQPGSKNSEKSQKSMPILDIHGMQV